MAKGTTIDPGMVNMPGAEPLNRFSLTQVAEGC